MGSNFALSVQEERRTLGETGHLFSSVLDFGRSHDYEPAVICHAGGSCPGRDQFDGPESSKPDDAQYHPYPYCYFCFLELSSAWVTEGPSHDCRDLLTTDDALYFGRPRLPSFSSCAGTSRRMTKNSLIPKKSVSFSGFHSRSRASSHLISGVLVRPNGIDWWR